MKPNRIPSGLLALFVLSVLVSCGKKDLFETKERGDLIEFSALGTLSKNEVVQAVTEFSVQDLVQYDVSYYSLTYSTVYDGKPIASRSLMLLPNGADSVVFTAYLHGTHVPLKVAGSEKQTPSNYRGGHENFLEVRDIALVLASAGYAVFMPDYIGYGITQDKEHPYVYYPEVFKSNIDGLLAAKDFMGQKGFPADNRLFITGWSQGAGACLSAHRYIQESYASDFTVVASSGLAGPYNFTAFLNDLFQKRDQEVAIIPIYSWGVYTVNKFSSAKRPTDQFWSYPVFDQTSSLSTPSTIPNKVFNNFFMAKIIDGSDAEMVNIIAANSFHQGWTPVGKVFLHHGDADEIVPYFNSVDAYNGLTAAGGDVTFYSYPGGKHDSEVENYVRKTISDFNALK